MISEGRFRIPLWSWPTVLALDAPLVAMGWLLAFQHQLGLSLDYRPALVLGLSVWLVYTADRVLDSFRLTATAPPTLRHAFAVWQRGPLLATWLGVLSVDLIVALIVLEPATLRNGLLLMAAAGLYFTQLQLGTGSRWKPVEVGLLFAAGIALFLGPEATPTALPQLLLFAGVCALNCSYIGVWEHGFDDGSGPLPPPSRWQLGVATWSLLAVALAAALTSRSTLYLLLALAVVALRGLHAAADRLLGRSALRSLADAALLLPLLLL